MSVLASQCSGWPAALGSRRFQACPVSASIRCPRGPPVDTPGHTLPPDCGAEIIRVDDFLRGEGEAAAGERDVMPGRERRTRVRRPAHGSLDRHGHSLPRGEQRRTDVAADGSRLSGRCAQPGVEDFTSVDPQNWVPAQLTGVAVGGAVLVLAPELTARGIQIDRHWRIPKTGARVDARRMVSAITRSSGGRARR